MAMVHGDYFVTPGSVANLEWLRIQIAKAMEIKTGLIGPNIPAKQLCLFGRDISWEEEQGVRYEGDP